MSKRLKAAIDAGRSIDEVSVTGSGDISRHVTSIDERGKYEYDEIRDGIYSLQFTPDGDHLAVGYGDGCIELLSVTRRNLSLKRELKKHLHGGLAVTSIKFMNTNPDICLAGTSEGKVHMCSTIDGSCREVVREIGNEINCLDLSMTGSRFATAGKDLAVRVYDAETCRLLSSYQGYSYNSPEQSHSGHAQRIFALRYFPEEETVFVTGGWDNHLKIWDSRTAEGVIGTIPGPHICGDSIDIKGTTLLTGSWVAQDALQLWDLASCSLIQNVPVQADRREKGSGEFIYCCRICDNGVILSAGSGTQSVQAYNIDTDQHIGELKLGKPVQALDISNGGQHLAFGGVGTELKLAALH